MSRRGNLLLTMVVLPAFVLGTASAAAGAPREAGVAGDFSLMAMVHTTTYDDRGTMRETRPWDGSGGRGTYSYASIPCAGGAPVNNISTNLTTYNGRLPGSRSPASTRNHPLRFTVEPGARLHGTVALTACKLGPGASTDGLPDSARDKVYLTWSGGYRQTSPEEVHWSGTFRLAGGTGVYRGITGRGTMAGYFFCFAAEGCSSLGEFRDGQYTMTGTYQDSTPR